jgi:hypothetical protein
MTVPLFDLQQLRHRRHCICRFFDFDDYLRGIYFLHHIGSCCITITITIMAPTPLPVACSQNVSG